MAASLGVLRLRTKEPPRVELTSLFGAEAVGRTGPLGALWGRGEAVQRNAKFQEEILAPLPSPNQQPLQRAKIISRKPGRASP